MSLSSTFESLGLGFIEYDASGEVVTSNDEARRILGDELSSRSLFDNDPSIYIYDTNGTQLKWDQLPAHQAFTTSKRSGPLILGVRADDEGSIVWIKMRATKVDSHVLLEVEEVTYDKDEIDNSFKNALWYETLVNSALETLFVHDLQGRFIHVNDKACQNLGYTREELLSMSVFDIEVGHTRDQIQNIFEHYVVGQTAVIEGVHRTKYGTTIPVEIRVFALEWLGKKIMVGMAHDLREQKNAEENLKKSEEKFRSLFEDHAAVKLVIDPESSQILNANNAASEFYGYTIDQLKSMYVHDINILSKEEITAEIKNAIEAKRINFHFKHRKADGSIADVDVFSSIVNWDVKKVLHSIIHDITSAKAIQERLSLLNRAVESSAVSIVITNSAGEIIYVNPFFTRVSGYTYEEALGNNPRILKSGAQSREFYQALWNTITSGRDWKGELQNRRKDGTLYWEKSVISPIADEKGEIRYFVAVKEDITMMKTYYETVEIQNSALRDIAWLQSHELRAPLVKIMGLVMLLIEEDYEILSKEHILTAILSASNEIDGTIRYIAKRTDSVRLVTSKGGNSET